MVVVGMGHQDRVHTAQRLRVHGDRAPQMPDAVPEQRIREETDAVEVDDGRRVPDVLDPHRLKARSR